VGTCKETRRVNPWTVTEGQECLDDLQKYLQGLEA
jgi:hypothetical protein